MNVYQKILEFSDEHERCPELYELYSKKVDKFIDEKIVKKKPTSTGADCI